MFDPRCVDSDLDRPSWSIPFHKRSDDYYSEECITRGRQWQSPETEELIKKFTKEGGTKGLKGSELHNYVKTKCQPTTQCLDVPDHTCRDGATALHAKDILAELSQKDKPFLFAVGFHKPHLPFNAPKKYWELYDREKLPLATFRGPAEDSPGEAYQSGGEIKKYCDIPGLADYSMRGILLPDDKQKELIHGYYAAVTYADALIGKLMAALQELKLTVRPDSSGRFVYNDGVAIAILFNAATPGYTGNFPDGTWVHVAIVRDGSGFTFYVDGSLVNSMPMTVAAGDMPAAAMPFFIGGEPGAYTTEHFSGGIDDVVIYDRALSASEVLNVMNGIYEF